MYQLEPIPAKEWLIAYLRVSTPGQESYGLSLGEQYKLVEAYCEKHGHLLFAVYMDAFTGAEEWDKRLVFQAAVQEVKNNIFATGLLVPNFDRYSRQLLSSETVRVDLQRNGKSLISAQQDLDLSDPYGVCFFQIGQSFAELQRKQIIKRLVDCRQAKIDRGGWGGARPHYGYRAEGKDLKEDKDEQWVIRLIARLYKYAGYNQNEITRYLNARYSAEKLRNPKGPHKFAPKQMRPTTRPRYAPYQRYKSYEWGQPAVRNLLIRVGLGHLYNSTRGRPPKNPTATYTRDGKPPYGYFRIYGALTPNPDEQHALRLIRRLYKFTLVSPAAMAKLLNCLREDVISAHPDSDKFACRAVSTSKLQNIAWSEGMVLHYLRRDGVLENVRRGTKKYSVAAITKRQRAKGLSTSEFQRPRK